MISILILNQSILRIIFTIESWLKKNSSINQLKIKIKIIDFFFIFKKIYSDMDLIIRAKQ